MEQIMKELQAQIIKEIGIQNLAAKLAPKVMQQIEKNILEEMADFDFSDISYEISNAVSSDLSKMLAQKIKSALKQAK